MPLVGKGKWVKDKILVLPDREDCYIYKRPRSSTWQYFLKIDGEGSERKSTGETDKDLAIQFALDRKLEVMTRLKQGLKARRVKKMFDFIDDFLEEESKRISDYNRSGFITKETFRIKSHHLTLLKRFYHNRSIKLEDIDYVKLKDYPLWRTRIDKEYNPKPPKTNHTILTELTTIRAYFEYLKDKGYISLSPEFKSLKSESIRQLRRDYLNPREYMQTINTIRKWCNSKNLTPTQEFNRKMLYQSILIMSNSCIRKGELKGLRWMDLESNTNLSKDDKDVGHLIRIRKENTKTGVSRTVQSPTTKRFNDVRELCGIPKHRGSEFPHVPPEYRSQLVFHKFNHPDEPLGQGTWNRAWTEIKKLCSDRYWNMKNITWYSFRHTGISFAVSRSVPLLQLSRNCGTGLRYIEDVYFHHESESKATWELLSKNRTFYNKIQTKQNEVLIEIEDALDSVEDS